MGGYSPAGTYDIEFITISTLGDSQDFGDMANTHAGGSTTNDRTRGWYSGGSIPSAQDHMTFVTIASLGNATDAGSLTAATQGLLQGLSSSTRGLQVGGRNSSGDEINAKFKRRSRTRPTASLERAMITTPTNQI